MWPEPAIGGTTDIGLVHPTWLLTGLHRIMMESDTLKVTGMVIGAAGTMIIIGIMTVIAISIAIVIAASPAPAISNQFLVGDIECRPDFF